MGYALSGKTALVTGANRGIGEAVVDALVAAGVKKVYAAARNISTLDPLVDRHGSRVVRLQLDVTNAAQIAAAATTATDVDLLVNNAGIVGFHGGDFTNPKWIEAGRLEMEVNVFGTLAVTQAFAPVLAKNADTQKGEDKATSSSCSAYQQAPDGSWEQLPCKETGERGQPQTQHRSRSPGPDREER